MKNQDQEDIEKQKEETADPKGDSKGDPKGENEIDLLELAQKLWQNRRQMLIWTAVAAVIGVIVAFSIPKEYATVVKLAPESSGAKTGGGGLGALASMAGISVGSASGADAVYPQLYPDVVHSVPFATSLFNVEVVSEKDGATYTVSQFLDEETSVPWWTTLMSLPSRIPGWFKSGSDEGESEHVTDNFRLTAHETGLVGRLNSRITANVDQKTNVVTISVEMQDPRVAAILADTVVKRLQEYVTDYRTNKARKDLQYAEKLNAEAQQDYYKAQQQLADFIDRNQNIATRAAQINQDRLENEASLAFNLYNMTSQQVQTAKAKVQETTPVYAVITPSTVNIRPVSPKKGLIIGAFAFLGFVACGTWILFGSPLVNTLKTKKSSDSRETEDGN